MSAIVAFLPGNNIRPESKRNNNNNNNNENIINDDKDNIILFKRAYLFMYSQAKVQYNS